MLLRTPNDTNDKNFLNVGSVYFFSLLRKKWIASRRFPQSYIGKTPLKAKILRILIGYYCLGSNNEGAGVGK